MTRSHWSRQENELVVDAYLGMLCRELAGQAFNISKVRRELIPQLAGRSAGSVEFKFRNVSAAMLQMGYPIIVGYKPSGNFQKELLDVVIQRTIAFTELDTLSENAVKLPAVQSDKNDYADARDPRLPKRQQVTADKVKEPTPFRRNFMEIEAHNRSLGLAGELFIVDYERWRLRSSGKSSLADQVRHVSVVDGDGDGAGYDIQSYTESGKPLYVEVKTTAFDKLTPFWISAHELAYGNANASQFQIARVYNFRNDPRFFEMPGRPDQYVNLNPSTFRASFQAGAL